MDHKAIALEAKEYGKREEEKYRRKIILPVIIPWECGSNKFASQKGSGGFGAIRNNVTKVKSTRELSESNDGIVPRITCPPLWDKELGSQSGSTPFGSSRAHVTKVKENDGETKKEINKLCKDRKSESILKIWSQPNRNCQLKQQFGKHRDAVTEVVGGRRFNQSELNACRAAIPRFQDPRGTVAAKAQKTGDVGSGGLINNRKTITPVDGMNRTLDEELDSNRYMAWLGGQLTLQSQSRTGGFQKTRDVVSTSYYDRIMSERERKPRKEKQNDSENSTIAEKRIVEIQNGSVISVDNRSSI